MVTKKKPAATAAVAPIAAPAAAESEGQAKASGLKIRDLVERVAAASGAKKKAVKEIAEATLAQLGEALSKGEELNLPGLGRVRVVKTADKAGAAHMTLKLRRGPHKPREGAGKETLAEDGEDS